MKNEKLRPKVLSTRMIANSSSDLIAKLGVATNYKSLGLITSDMDDVTYTALDEATKSAQVEVLYAKSMYAGAGNASTLLAGEVIGIIGGQSPAEVQSGLNAALKFMENDGYFLSANDDNSIVYYSHLISRTGSYLSKVAG
ncbi:MAG: ethanolamine utilization microcompartment protein EutL, partial [Clostridia bacterium]|nr:ethanolamine utilization microcompartment protein EutL [Clostridia bacterium]